MAKNSFGRSYVEDLHNQAPEKPVVGKLHLVRYKNFLVEHGRMQGEKKTLLHFTDVKMEPNAFLDLLRRHFDCQIKPRISYDTDVIMGSCQDRGAVNAYSILWNEDLSDGMLGWIKRKVIELNDLLDTKPR